MVNFYFDLSETSLEEAKSKILEAASSLNADSQQPLFVLLEQVNLFDASVAPTYSAFPFDRNAITNLFDMLNNPEEAWNIYNNGHNEIESDVVFKIARKKKKPSEDDDLPEVWNTTKLALYHSGMKTKFEKVLKNTPFEPFLEHLPTFKEKQVKHLGVFNAKFNGKFNDIRAHDEYEGKEAGFYNFWRNIRDDLTKRREFCFSKQFVCDGLTHDEKEQLIQIPCIIYALRQCNVSETVLSQILNHHICYGNTIKKQDLTTILNANKIRVIVYELQLSRGKYITNPKKYNPQCEGPWTTVELDFFKGHIMKHEKHEIVYKGSRNRERKIMVHFLDLLQWAFDQKFLVNMNCYEFSKVLETRGFVNNFKAQTAEILDSLEDPSCLEGDCELFSGSDKSSPIYKVYFDFECSTDEIYHRPYSVSFKINSKIKHYWAEKKLNTKIDQYYYDDVGEKFLMKLRHKFRKEAKGGWNQPVCVAYAHNLKYDIQFLMKYLKRINPVMKDNKLYSLKAVYGKGKDKICIEFRDTLPLLQMSLKKAGECFLSERQKKKIKKEAFPYQLYTFSFFDAHPSGWCTLEEFRNGFQDKKALEEFDKNLPNLPIEIYDPSTQHVFYKEYCHFYCDQDVRVLYNVMEAFDEFMTNDDSPFGNAYSPFDYLTISSLAYDYMIKNTILNKEVVKVVNGKPQMAWVPRFPIYTYSCLARYFGQNTVRGGRTMVRDNRMYHYKADSNNPKSLIVDYDAVSLYPSAISKLWITEGTPKIIKGRFSQRDFIEKFTHPDALEGEFKQYNDGWVHIYSLNCNKDRHFPLLCVKDPVTKLNEYKNFHGAVDTWVNAIDLFNLIEFQNAEFQWDAAVVWEGPRHYECRDVIKKLFQLKLHAPNPMIRFLAKLMMNSIYGKSVLKPTNHVTKIIDSKIWRYLGTDVKPKFEKEDNWRNIFNANAYRIKKFSYHPQDKEHITVKFHQLDDAHTFVPFGSNVLAMARRIVGRVMALAEDMEELHPECCPGIFYTDTDSMHIRIDLLEYTEQAYMEKYGQPIKGADMCQFHIDFDPLPGNEEVLGANESWFLAKKMYADHLIGVNGGEGYHQRMKGIPGDLIEWDHYKRLFNGETIEYNLLANGHVSFVIENGTVSSRLEMKREIKVKEAVELEKDYNLIQNLVEGLEDEAGTPTLEEPPTLIEPTPYQPPEWQEWMEGDTPKLEWEAMEIQEEIETQKRQRDEIDIETEDEDLEIPDPKKLKCYESIEDPKDLNMIISIENGHPPTHWERRVFDEGWDPETDEDMINWWKTLGKEQREWLLKLRGDK